MSRKCDCTSHIVEAIKRHERFFGGVAVDIAVGIMCHLLKPVSTIDSTRGGQRRCNGILKETVVWRSDSE
jgi:hypothetical protein